MMENTILEKKLETAVNNLERGVFIFYLTNQDEIKTAEKLISSEQFLDYIGNKGISSQSIPSRANVNITLSDLLKDGNSLWVFYKLFKEDDKLRNTFPILHLDMSNLAETYKKGQLITEIEKILSCIDVNIRDISCDRKRNKLRKPLIFLYFTPEDTKVFKEEIFKNYNFLNQLHLCYCFEKTKGG